MEAPKSSDHLLDCAYEIADKYGLAALSIRGLASACGVSVGTIYNRFASKGELTTATALLYFRRAFYDDFCHPVKNENYLAFCKRMFASMTQVILHYRTHWLKGSEALPSAEKAAARLHEEQQFEHICRGLVQVFENDSAIKVDLPGALSAQAVSEFTLRNILWELRQKEPDCSVLFTLLESTLY